MRSEYQGTAPAEVFGLDGILFLINGISGFAQGIAQA
ncbi:hypothetical protein A8950_3556 [Dongia mobilis]|uniref:Uncharacterized protein n=1 Tax=Dongia mobilis TaxID=578943 RepID=A0A4R6WJ13_9PROT|nr:hypothetical protein A8950_3556 [Dongia mobilis]